MFDRILIANRGEIACRIARTARRMGVHTVAVYSDADAGALHVAACDEAFRLGPPPPRESYLNGERIIAIAAASGAQAIHPGYGFLSENADFAEAVATAGLVFIGPPPAAIRAMGSKSAAKNIMGDAGVPLVPGYHGAGQDDALLAREADAIGYPVLIKASAGGGGKGMRIVARREEFTAALASARRESRTSFGDDTVLLEKYLAQPRHIEVQVFADTHGQCVYLFERDCSVQRRHQKVLEEAPAPGMTAERRARMGTSAVAAAQAIGYVGAGTVEFIADPDGTFYFMEMNTRLQVEHPVTEMITGLDLVEWQLLVAAGEPLPKRQQELAIDGHAIEARIYAEDPDRGFLPSIGRITHLREAAQSARVRVDTGVAAGDEISQYYDPMIAKLIVHGGDRAEACRGLALALAQYQIVGVTTNLALLRRIIAHAAFSSAQLDTGLIERHRDALFPPATPVTDEVLAIAALGELSRLRDDALARARASGDPHSPWQAIDTWWLNSVEHAITLMFSVDEAKHVVQLRTRDGSVEVAIGDRKLTAAVERMGADLAVTLDGRRLVATVVALGDDRYVFVDGRMYRLHAIDALAHADEEERHGGHLTAPMSGAIVEVVVKQGERVARGAPLLILGAMKMEHTITAPAAGKVSAVHYRKGDQVQEGANLIDIDDGPQA